VPRRSEIDGAHRRGPLPQARGHCVKAVEGTGSRHRGRA
jgi:hypothetical protein